MEGQGKDKPLAIDEKKSFMDVDGLRLAPRFDPNIIRKAMKYKPKAGQIIVASYPRSGTHWTITMVLLLLRKGEPIRSAREFFNSFAFLESFLQVTVKDIPRCIETHLPFDRITYSPDAKYIHVIRHPADCFVSQYHFYRSMLLHEFPDNCFDQLFEHFLRGNWDYGDYFDHLLSWYEQRNLPNVLVLTFESIKKDHEGALLKIAKFLDESLVGELMANGGSMLKRMVHESSLETMQKYTNSFYDSAYNTPPNEEDDFGSIIMKNMFHAMEAATKRGFKHSSRIVRNGNIGEGKLTLSEDQKRKLNIRILEKTAHSDVMNLWKDDSM